MRPPYFVSEVVGKRPKYQLRIEAVQQEEGRYELKRQAYAMQPITSENGGNRTETPT
jgi:hypothetical protein